MSAHGQGLQRFRDRSRPADLDDTIDAAAIDKLAHFASRSDTAGVSCRFNFSNRPSCYPE